MEKVTSKSDYNDIRIYINNILHIKIPRDNKMKIQTWTKGGKSKEHHIEIRSKDHSDIYAYQNFDTWKNIINELDNLV